MEGKVPVNDFGKSFHCREIRAQVRLAVASFRCYDNNDVIATLIIKNFHLYVMQLWWTLFPNLCYRSLFSNLGGIDPEKPYRATFETKAGENRTRHVKI